MVNFKAIQKIHKKVMYHDICDVYKFEAIIKSNGAKSTQRQKIPVYTDVPCKISFSLRTWDMFTNKSIDTYPYEKQPKIFMEVEYILEPGYYIVAKRLDPKTKQIIATYEGQCGKSQVSLTHQEVLLDVRGDS